MSLSEKSRIESCVLWKNLLTTSWNTIIRVDTDYNRYPNHWIICLFPLTCRSLRDRRISLKEEFGGHFVFVDLHEYYTGFGSHVFFSRAKAVCGKSHNWPSDWLTKQQRSNQIFQNIGKDGVNRRTWVFHAKWDASIGFRLYIWISKLFRTSIFVRSIDFTSRK